MKPIKQTKEVVIGYETDDGHFFTTEEECKKYETTAAYAINQQWNQIAIEVCHDYMPAYINEDDTVRIVDLNSVERLTIANMYAKQIGCGTLFNESMLGSRVAVHGGYGEIWGVYTRQQMIDLYTKFVDSLFGEDKQEGDPV